MSSRTLYLVVERGSARERAHFSVFLPYKGEGTTGTIIQVIGAPMVGYAMEFKRSHDLSQSIGIQKTFSLGQIGIEHVHIWTGGPSIDDVPRGNLEQAAAQLPPPRKNENFLAPVNDVSMRKGP